jgi:hypothetical protein
MEKLIENYGILGIILVALAAYVIRIEKRHGSERKEWRETMEKQFNRMDEMSDEGHKAVRENTSILQGLKTLLENRNKR